MNSALINNPYREWIGALIRADLWGWVSPGNPEQAVRCAFKDASLTHLNNGILGAVFISALLSMAFFVKDIDELIESAIKFIPEESEIYDALIFSVSISKKNKEWEWTLDKLYQRFDHLHWVHVINNSALIIASLLYGKNDFEKSICAAVMGGWDTDSNAATVGSVVGTITGI